MTVKTPIATDSAPKAIGPYSQAIKVTAQEMVFCSGQIGLDPNTQKMVEGGVEAEMRRALENLQAVLNAAGMSLDNVVRTTVFLQQMGDFQQVNTIYGEFFTGTCPARAAFEVAALPLGAQVEIDAIAAR